MKTLAKFVKTMFSSDHPAGLPYDKDAAIASTDSLPISIGIASSTSSFAPAMSDPLDDGEDVNNAMASQPPTWIANRYRWEGELGSGAFGCVHKYVDSMLPRTVAVKFSIRQHGEGQINALLHEAQAAARIKHPAVVSVLDCSTLADGRFYVMYDFIQGRTLEEAIRAGDFTRETAVRWVIELCEGLQAVHDQQLVHRDVKPANILIDEKGSPHLTDFGLARMDDTFFFNDRGSRIGTRAYMSPEQTQRRSHLVSSHSDVWSMGVVLYELLCGRRPFQGNTPEELFEQIQAKTPEPPSRYNRLAPPSLDRACLKALAKNPENRYQSAHEFAAALRKTLPRKRHRFAWAAWLLVIGTVASAAFWLGRDNRTPQVFVPAAVTSSVTKEPLAPKLEVSHWPLEQPMDDAAQSRQILSVGNSAWQAGDHVQIHVTTPAARFLYLFWYDAETGRIERKLPRSLDEQRRSSAASTPRMRITGGHGQDALLAIASVSSLDAAACELLSSALTHAMARLPQVTLVNELLPPSPNEISGTPLAASRTVRAAVNIEEGAEELVLRLPASTEAEFARQHAVYHGWLVPRR